MAAGARDRCLTFYQREGVPPEWKVLRKSLWGSLKAVKSLRAGAPSAAALVGLRRAQVYEIGVARHVPVEPGILIAHKGRKGMRYFAYEGEVDGDDRSKDIIIVAREFVGSSAIYRRANGEEYPCRASLVHRNVEQMRGPNKQLFAVDIELMIIELKWPWAASNDRIVVQGTEYIIDGVATAGYDGYTVVVNGQPNEPDKLAHP